MKSGPIQFLVAVAVLWGVARSTIVWNTPEQMAEDLKSLIAWADPPARADMVPPRRPLPPNPPVGRQQAKDLRLSSIAARLPGFPTRPAIDVRISSVIVAANRAVATSTPLSPGVATSAPPPRASPTLFTKRLTLSSWAIVRGAGTSALATGGQLGGSQAGVRASFELSPHFALAGRLSTPLRERGAEAAVALNWRPIRTLPVTLTAERRVRVDRDGRNAFAVGLFGGVDAIALPAEFRLDTYAQAGVVGVKRRDAYVDGTLRIERSIAEYGQVRIAAGGGIWGVAQPGVTRLDIGPQLVARIPVGTTSLRLGLDWRQRVAGNARPGSGPAVSMGTDF